MLTTWCLAAVMLAGPFLAPPPRAGGEPPDLQGLVKTGVERVVSFVLEAPTTVGGFAWDPEKKRLDLKDVRIGNPESFGTGEAIAVKNVSLESDLKSLLSEQPQIRLIEVGGVTVNVETVLGKGNNLKKLLDNTKRIQPRGGTKLKMPAQRSGEQKRWIIDKAVLDKSTINMSMPLLESQNKAHEFGPIEMSFKGADGGGMTANEILGQVMERLLQESGLGGSTGASPVEGLIEQILIPKK
ncbi:MAG: hypothetical protein IT365_19050 [Candidatus Hydrogenedentes bacterium]|nr:hypothetical protein [Candidatus Hydrogenedentota bacterium]